MKIFLFFLSWFCCGIISCSKDWLDVKPNQQIVVPMKLKELQALLDNEFIMNDAQSQFSLQNLAETGCDNYYVTKETLDGLAAVQEYAKNAYLFHERIFDPVAHVDAWNVPYERVFYCNVVLEGLQKINPSLQEQPAYNEAKGAALFIRAHSFSWLQQIFAPPYNKTTAGKDLGIVLRLNADIHSPSKRSSVNDCYKQILDDLVAAADLLPSETNYPMRPTKYSAYGLLSRMFLTQGNYEKSLEYALLCINAGFQLMDYNLLDTVKSFPVPRGNSEMLYRNPNATTFFFVSRCRVDSNLIMSFVPGDLRKPVFFKPGIDNQYFTYNGSYEGSEDVNGGICLDEMYLNAAECYARLGNTSDAMAMLNQLLIYRWEKDHFTPLTAANEQEALDIILAERRKELCFRGLRWLDLRRLNTEERYKVKVTRNIDGQLYELLPGDKKYVYPIPGNVIQFTGIPQNER